MRRAGSPEISKASAARQQVHREILALFPAGSALDLHRVFVDAVAAELYRRPRAA